MKKYCKQCKQTYTGISDSSECPECETLFSPEYSEEKKCLYCGGERKESCKHMKMQQQCKCIEWAECTDCKNPFFGVVSIPSTDSDWRIEFREYFDKTLKPKKPTMANLDRELCVNFIENLIQLEREEQKEKLKVNIGKLRQWLNEDRITDTNKMVTNEELLVWFKDK